MGDFVLWLSGEAASDLEGTGDVSAFQPRAQLSRRMHSVLGSKRPSGAALQAWDVMEELYRCCQTRGQGWSELRPPLPGADSGVTRTMQSFGNAGVPNNCQEMSIQTVVTSSTLDTVFARSCGELAPT